MQDRTIRVRRRPARTFLHVCAAVGIVFGGPAAASAQYNAPSLTSEAIGEAYHVELAGTLWNPTLTGIVSSDQFGQIGTDLDFVSDLGFEQKRFRDLRMVLRPARKHRIRLQYTPVSYLGQHELQRTITFNGISFPASIPVTSEFDWKVWRFGYEYDMFYRSRGFFGAFVEARYTNFMTSLQALNRSEFTSAKAPLPAGGLVGRAYVAKNVALNVEVSGFRLPNFDPKYAANYSDWDISGTVNLTNNVGLEIGWRRLNTFLHIEEDEGDFKFQGLWFGGAVRY